MTTALKNRFRIAGAMALLTLGGAGLIVGAEAKADQGHFLLVQIRARNFLATPARIKAGTVKVLIENFTMVVSPTVTIQTQAQLATTEGVKVGKVTKSKPRETWHEVVLAPGTYWVSLDQVAGVQAALVVEP